MFFDSHSMFSESSPLFLFGGRCGEFGRCVLEGVFPRIVPLPPLLPGDERSLTPVDIILKGED